MPYSQLIFHNKESSKVCSVLIMVLKILACWLAKSIQFTNWFWKYHIMTITTDFHLWNDWYHLTQSASHSNVHLCGHSLYIYHHEYYGKDSQVLWFCLRDHWNQKVSIKDQGLLWLRPVVCTPSLSGETTVVAWNVTVNPMAPYKWENLLCLISIMRCLYI